MKYKTDHFLHIEILNLIAVLYIFQKIHVISLGLSIFSTSYIKH
jgi:hypothetical protein